MKLLALGDVVGAYGTRETAALLPRLRRETGADFVVVNAENAAPGNGTDPASAEARCWSREPMCSPAATTRCGGTTFSTCSTSTTASSWLLNYPAAAPGKGFTILRVAGVCASW